MLIHVQILSGMNEWMNAWVKIHWKRSMQISSYSQRKDTGSSAIIHTTVFTYMCLCEWNMFPSEAKGRKLKRFFHMLTLRYTYSDFFRRALFQKLYIASTSLSWLLVFVIHEARCITRRALSAARKKWYAPKILGIHADSFVQIHVMYSGFSWCLVDFIGFICTG